MTSPYTSGLYWAQQSAHENIPEHNFIFCKKKNLYIYNSQCIANSAIASTEE